MNLPARNMRLYGSEDATTKALKKVIFTNHLILNFLFWSHFVELSNLIFATVQLTEADYWLVWQRQRIYLKQFELTFHLSQDLELMETNLSYAGLGGVDNFNKYLKQR